MLDSFLFWHKPKTIKFQQLVDDDSVSVEGLFSIIRESHKYETHDIWDRDKLFGYCGEMLRRRVKIGHIISKMEEDVWCEVFHFNSDMSINIPKPIDSKELLLEYLGINPKDEFCGEL
jgi:hypothetical protein